MSRIHVAALLALSALAVLTSTAFAQTIFAPPSGVSARGNPGGVQDRDVPICQTSGGGTRRRANCEPEPTTVRTEQELKELKISIEPAELPNAQCDAAVTTEYLQRNTIARVESTIKIANCTAAAGTFTAVLRIRDESGAITPLEFSETWQRSDDQNVSFKADYPIGENVELVNVRVRGLRCTCADLPSEN